MATSKAERFKHQSAFSFVVLTSSVILLHVILLQTLDPQMNSPSQLSCTCLRKSRG